MSTCNISVNRFHQFVRHEANAAQHLLLVHDDLLHRLQLRQDRGLGGRLVLAEREFALHHLADPGHGLGDVGRLAIRRDGQGGGQARNQQKDSQDSGAVQRGARLRSSRSRHGP